MVVSFVWTTKWFSRSWRDAYADDNIITLSYCYYIIIIIIISCYAYIISRRIDVENMLGNLGGLNQYNKQCDYSVIRRFSAESILPYYNITFYYIGFVPRRRNKMIQVKWVKRMIWLYFHTAVRTRHAGVFGKSTWVRFFFFFLFWQSYIDKSGVMEKYGRMLRRRSGE